MPNNLQNNEFSIALKAILQDFHTVCDLVPNGTYNNPTDKSSIGSHIRHILEFIQILNNNAAGGEVNYEHRVRNKLYESDPAVAKLASAKAIRSLENTLGTYGESHIIYITETPGFGINQVQVTSTLGREILFAIQHSVHHFAIVKMLAEKDNIKLPDNFGVACATQNHNLAKCAQ